MTQNTVIIIGAGPAGLTQALLLADANINCIVIDHVAQKLTTKRDDNRTAALLRPSVDILARCGVEAEHLPGTSALRSLQLVDVPAGKASALLRTRFDAHEINEPYFALNIRNDELHHALLAQALVQPLIQIISPAQIQKIETTPGYIHITTDHGNDIRGALIIGADGKNSRVRALSQIDVDHIDYQQAAITCAISHEKPHNDTSTEFHRPGGPFTLVPLQGHQSSIVWMERQDVANDIMALSPDEFAQRLQTESHGELGAITVLNTPQCWPITWQCAHQLTGNRVALVAEAAHALPPSGAQGLNLSLRDVDTLAGILTEAASLGLDLGSKTVLQRYTSARRRDIMPRSYAVDGLNRLILADNRFVRMARRYGLNAASTIQPLRRALMRFGWAQV